MLHTPKSSIYVLKVASQFLCKSILLQIWQHHSYKEVPLWHLVYSWKKTLLPGILLKFFTYFKIGNKQVKGTSNSNIASPKTKWRSFSHPPTLLSSLGDWWVLVHPCPDPWDCPFLLTHDQSWRRALVWKEGSICVSFMSPFPHNMHLPQSSSQ